jgi:hypothetical protein
MATSIFVLTLGMTLKLKFLPSLDIQFATGNELYINSFTRMAPYFPGVAGGWIYVVYKNRPSPVSMVGKFHFEIFKIGYTFRLFSGKLEKNCDFFEFVHSTHDAQ